MSQTQAPMAMPTVINGTSYVPALNGSLINDDDCTTQICSLAFAQLSYIPSFAGNLVYLILFGVFLLAHLVLGPLYRTWGFFVGVFCGLLLEIVGYIGRMLLNNNVFDFNYFVTSLVCLTIAPAFISASIYLCLGRLIVVYGRHVARFSPKVYMIVFVTSDIISLVLQAAGGATASIADSGSSAQDAGVNIMIAGLSFQVASLTIFMILGLDFAFAVYRARENELNGSFSALRSRGLFRLFPLGLAVATVTIFVRCAFRVAELKDGFGGKLANDQTAFMVLEGPMILIAALALTVLHPGVCFGGAQTWQDANWTWKTPKSGFSTYQVENADSTELQEQKANHVRYHSDDIPA